MDAVYIVSNRGPKSLEIKAFNGSDNPRDFASEDYPAVTIYISVAVEYKHEKTNIVYIDIPARFWLDDDRQEHFEVDREETLAGFLSTYYTLGEQEEIFPADDFAADFFGADKAALRAAIYAQAADIAEDIKDNVFSALKDFWKED